MRQDHLRSMQALDAQLDVLSHLRSAFAPRYFEAWFEDWERKGKPVPYAPIDWTVDAPSGQRGLAFTSYLRHAINRAETFYVTRDMGAVIASAGKSMPDEPLLASDLPSQAGFIYLESPIITRDIRNTRQPVRIITWTPTMQGDEPGVVFSFWSDASLPDDAEHNLWLEKGSMLGRYTVYHMQPMTFGHILVVDPYKQRIEEARSHLTDAQQKIGEWEEMITAIEQEMEGYPDDPELPVLLEQATKTRDETRQIIAASQSRLDEISQQLAISPALMTVSEPGLLDELIEQMTTQPILQFIRAFFPFINQRLAGRTGIPTNAWPRALRRRAVRADLPVNQINFITLRKYVDREQEQGDGTGEGQAYRQLVHGHWKHQYYPKLGGHRLIYVEDYVRGDDSLPLIIKDRVFKVSR